jgi:hypothetical protein
MHLRAYILLFVLAACLPVLGVPLAVGYGLGVCGMLIWLRHAVLDALVAWLCLKPIARLDSSNS